MPMVMECVLRPHRLPQLRPADRGRAARGHPHRSQGHRGLSRQERREAGAAGGGPCLRFPISSAATARWRRSGGSRSASAKGNWWRWWAPTARASPRRCAPSPASCRPRAGSIRLQGDDVTRAGPQKMLKLGVAHCPEGRRVFPHMSVSENLAMGAYLRASDAGLKADYERIYTSFPRLAERRHQMARHPFRRRAADAGHRPRAHVEAPPRAVRRAFARAGAEHRGADVRHHRFHPRRRHPPCSSWSRTPLPRWNCATTPYLLEAGRIVMSGKGADLIDDPHVRAAYLGS